MAEKTPEELRAIDAMVAEKVMKWVVHHRNTAFYYIDGYTISDTPRAAISEWCPTRCIAYAWMVVEKMRERGFQMDTKNYLNGKTTAIAFKGDDSWHATEESAPLAIALAALSALGAKP